jgi:hypothetical protein
MPGFDKVVIVTRKSALDELVERFNTRDQARFYIEHQGADFQDYLKEDETYHHALVEAERTLAGIGRVQTVDRAFLPNFIFAPEDTIVTLGQDGLVANTLKYLNGQPVVGVNPDPGRWDGKLWVRSGTARIAIVPDWDDDAPLLEQLPYFPGAQIQVTIPERAKR